jgi:hypothetical protein
MIKPRKRTEKSKYSLVELWLQRKQLWMKRKCIALAEKILGLKSNRKWRKRADMDVRKQL